MAGRWSCSNKHTRRCPTVTPLNNFLGPEGDTVTCGITGGGSGYAALLAHAEGALYGTELGSVTLKRIGLFCFPTRTTCQARGILQRPEEQSRTGGCQSSSVEDQPQCPGL